MNNIFTVGISIFLILLGFLSMEFISFFMHKYLQHGSLWFLHEDHHRYTKGRFEKNDIFSLFFSLITIVLLVFGFLDGFDYKFWFGCGIFLYGMGFFVYHDMVFHRRIKIRYKPKMKYLKSVIQAHRMHHQKSTAKDGVSFGFFIIKESLNSEN